MGYHIKYLSSLLVLFFILVIISFTNAQEDASHPYSGDSLKIEKWNYHFQTTVLTQYHPPIKAKYSGDFSMDTNSEIHTSISATLFFGIRLWKRGQIYFNPELTGGEGFSMTRGIAGFPTGEVYRVSNPSPQVYVARLYLKQVFALSKECPYVGDDFNCLAGKDPESYISLVAGKFSMLDFFDDNKYSHDPRTQFYNWALMGNGAWDYPANTRGYTYGIASELVIPYFSMKLGIVMVANEPNGSIMDKEILRANSSAIEIEKAYMLARQPGIIRLMGYFTQARMGNYRDAIDWGITNDTIPDLSSSRVLGHTKFGFGLNIEQNIGENSGIFFRASWNDGRNETWAFTEIDRAISVGISLGGTLWKMKDDNLGLSLLMNGLSADHRDYLKAGGHGFIIGDGKLNYKPEVIAEIYYSFRFFKELLWISPDYQFILNPAYNKDRGPVHAFGLRIHIEI
jgi:high affinity Mn2+ porin